MVFFVLFELLVSAPLSCGFFQRLVRVLAGSSNASVLSECHLRTVSVASCRRFSSQKDLRTAARKLSGIAQLEGARGGAGEPALQGASGASYRRGMRQTLPGSFSAASKRNFASKYALVTRCYAKQYEIVLRCMSPCSVCTGDFFQLEMLRISFQ